MSEYLLSIVIIWQALSASVSDSHSLESTVWIWQLCHVMTNLFSNFNVINLISYRLCQKEAPRHRRHWDQGLHGTKVKRSEETSRKVIFRRSNIQVWSPCVCLHLRNRHEWGRRIIPQSTLWSIHKLSIVFFINDTHHSSYTVV